MNNKNETTKRKHNQIAFRNGNLLGKLRRMEEQDRQQESSVYMHCPVELFSSHLYGNDFLKWQTFCRCFTYKRTSPGKPRRWQTRATTKRTITTTTTPVKKLLYGRFHAEMQNIHTQTDTYTRNVI